MASDLSQRVARLLCVGFKGTEVSPELRELVARGVRSVVLFARNVVEPEQVLALTQAIKALSAEPIAVAVDQEGGPVRRLRAGFSQVPAMRALGNADAALAERTGHMLGRELRAVGIDWNFAPVLDVDTNPDNPVIGKRAFSRSAQRVAELGVALARGLERASVAACGKHFPGHGDTEHDSHLDLPRLVHPLSRLDQVELVPFAAAVTAGIASIMSAHVVFSELDAEFPATLSPRVLRGLLRERLGYAGLVVSDDLEMSAIVEHYGIESAVLRGLTAGVDCFLVCHTAERMHAAIDTTLRAVEQSELDASLIDAALDRQRHFFGRWVQPAPAQLDRSALRCPEHLELEATLARLSQTIEEG
ncbi:MAG: beta-N-acetylhexosaminidase [Polyangiaceae bacterium]